MKDILYKIIAIAGTLLILYFFITYKAPYEWNVTLDTYDDQPFGCELFDSLASHVLEGEYRVRNDIPETLDPKRDAILYVKNEIAQDYYYMDSLEMDRGKKLLSFAQKGGVVIVATNRCEDYGDEDIPSAYGLSDNEDHDRYYNYNNVRTRVKEHQKDIIPKDTIMLTSTKGVYPLYDFMTGKCFSFFFDKKQDKMLFAGWNDSTKRYDNPVAFYRTYPSDGEMLFVSMLLLFTNYAVMDGKTVELTLAALSHVGNRNLTRIMGVNPKKDIAKKKKQDGSAFSFLLSKPPLRWALFLTIAVLVLFCIFNVKRKMRAIPLPPEQKNATLEFAKYMGTYYYRRKKHGAVVMAKYADMIFALSKLCDEDVSTWGNVQLSEELSYRTGISSERIIHLVRTVDRLNNNSIEITSQSMKKLLDLIQEINNKL